MDKSLYIVIPCYNEQEVLPITSGMFLEKLESLIAKGLCSEQSKILFVNDGSKDDTWQIIQKLAKSNDRFVGLTLSRNRGHQNALLAGLMWAKDRCDVTISIDCDGQDDVNAMDEFLKNYHEGCHVVYGVRSKRDTDTFFKRFTAEGFYKFMEMMGAQTVFNHADYRLMSKQALEGLDVLEVPYSGGSEMSSALVGGHIDLMITGTDEIRGLIASGDIVPILSLSEQRMKLFPDVECSGELGIESYMAPWRAIFAKTGTPQEAIDALVAAVEEAVQTDTWQEFLVSAAYDEREGFSKGEELLALEESEYQVFTEYLDEQGVLVKNYYE